MTEDKNTKEKCVAYPQDDFLFKILHSTSLTKKYVSLMTRNVHLNVHLI
jgi:hypothetical protein